MTGKNVLDTFQNESGGHRWQRIPPNDKKGRVHTSTITVAVLREKVHTKIEIHDDELVWKMTRGSGPGGQHKNKTDTCVVLTHVPTRTTVRCDSKSQAQNKKDAFAELERRLNDQRSDKIHFQRNSKRREQVGTGMRADKVRTIRCQDGTVKCHNSGRSMPLKKYLRGILPTKK